MADPNYKIMSYQGGSETLESLDELVMTLKALPISIGISHGHELPVYANTQDDADPILEVDASGTLISLRPPYGMRLSDASFEGDKSVFIPSRIMDECTGGGACCSYSFYTDSLGLPFSYDLGLDIYKLGTKEQRTPIAEIYPDVLHDQPRPFRFTYDDLCIAVTGYSKSNLIELASDGVIGPLDLIITDAVRTPEDVMVDRLALFQNIGFQFPQAESATSESLYEAYVQFRNWERSVHPDGAYRAYFDKHYQPIETAIKEEDKTAFIQGIHGLVGAIVHD